jgi:hypothetical protein
MKNCFALLCAAALGLLAAGCATRQPLAEQAVPPELTQQTNLCEVTRYLYRWDLDEADVERIADAPRLTFWVSRETPQLDTGDQSRFARILLPQLGIEVKLKQSDYLIEETGTRVQSRGYKIKNVARVSAPARAPAGAAVVNLDMAEMKAYLFRTRNQPDYPNAALVERLRQRVRDEVLKEKPGLTNAPTEDLILYAAPLSPVGNEVWFYLVNYRLLLRATSDIDLSNPEVWSREQLRVRVYDAYEQVVISLDEAAGSNSYMTRNQIGRALYNCLVLGQRITLPKR